MHNPVDVGGALGAQCAPSTVADRRKGRGEMDTNQFRELLIGYLTEPSYAEVERVGDADLLITLPDDGGTFFIEIEREVFTQALDPDADKCPGGIRLTSEPCPKCGATDEEPCAYFTDPA